MPKESVRPLPVFYVYPYHGIKDGYVIGQYFLAYKAVTNMHASPDRYASFPNFQQSGYRKYADESEKNMEQLSESVTGAP